MSVLISAFYFTSNKDKLSKYTSQGLSDLVFKYD